MQDDTLGCIDEFGTCPGHFDEGEGVFGGLEREGGRLEVQEFGVEEGHSTVHDARFGEGWVWSWRIWRGVSEWIGISG